MDAAADCGIDYYTVLFHDFYYAEAYESWKGWFEFVVEYASAKGWEFISFAQAVQELENRHR